ncbi:MAG: DNA-directed RNA polymerase subunit beta [Mycoplasmoidaceae bacterium]
MVQKNYKENLFSNKVLRRDYSKISRDFKEAPNLLDIQKNSFEKFLNRELDICFKSYFPITSAGGRYVLRYNKFQYEKPKRSEQECREEGKTYSSSLFVDFELDDLETGEIKTISKKKKNEMNGLFFCSIPIMTKRGTFIVNGVEKIIISQIVRSPGPYMFPKAQIKLNNSRKKVQDGYICEVLPGKGTMFIIFISKNKNQLNITFRNAHGDSTCTVNITEFFKALGLSNQSIKTIFGEDKFIIDSLSRDRFTIEKIELDEWVVSNLKSVNESVMSNDRAPTVEQYLKKIIYQLQVINQKIEIDPSSKNIEEKETILNKLIHERAAKYLVDELGISTRQQDTQLRACKNVNISYQTILCKHFLNWKFFDLTAAGRYKMIRKLRLSERLYQRVLAQNLYDKKGNIILKIGTTIHKEELDTIKKYINNDNLNIYYEDHLQNYSNSEDIPTKFSYEKIDVYADNEKLNEILSIIGVDNVSQIETLTISDIVSICSYVINIYYGLGSYDDIEHLGNKRIKLIHELLRQKYNVGILRLERFINEKLTNADGANSSNEENKKPLTVKSLINAKSFQIAIKEFFNSHQLTQFIDQQNPLSELTNKRRISAMGPGGISREDPNLDIRDVHFSQYGKICPIETPEGMNIGLIMSLTTFAKIDEKGLLLSPYWKVKNGKITDEVSWLTALREEEYIIAYSTDNIKNNKLLGKQVLCRFRTLQEFFSPEQVDYIDISPKQIVSIAASCIPFIENDDANRALMGANMQRQATPLIKSYAPIVGTGNEYKIACDSGMALLYDEDKEAIVKKIDGKSVELKIDGKISKIPFTKFWKTNQNTCNNQIPKVEVGQILNKGDLIADGPAMHNGELALGQNVLVAFTTWRGYNYEDAIVISSRLVNEDTYTSIHIIEHIVECVRTKNGDEEITRDVPNVSEHAKRFLDADGVIMVGAEVKEGDVLVGKISPKGKVDLSHEEKLLQAIFGEKTKNYKETSLKVSHGEEGTVAMIKRMKKQDNYELANDTIEQIKIYIVKKRKMQVGDKVAGRHGNKGIVSNIVPIEDMPHLKDGTPVDVLLNPLGVPSRMNIGQILEIHLGLAMRNVSIHKLLELSLNNASGKEFEQWYGMNPFIGEKLKNNVLDLLKEMNIKTLEKAKSSFGELQLSIIISRTGIIRDDLNLKVATPVFEGVNRKDLDEIMKEAGICPYSSPEGEGKDGKFTLIDGITGKAYDGPIAVGVMYILKLDHMVDDKIHARAVGSYSKITQQPLGGKSQNGGQRFGEMEVWALEAYGAAHNLREILTIKSDDVKGRNKTYSAIIKGKPLPGYGLPESFKLLTKKLQGLGLSLEITNENGKVEDINQYIANSTFSNDDEEENEEYKEEFINISNSFTKELGK